MPASKIAFVSAKKSLTSRSTPCSSAPWRSRRATNCPKRSQWPGGSSEFGPSAQYSAINFCSSVRPALSSRSACACVAYPALPYAGSCVVETGGGAANGVTFDQCGARNFGVTSLPLPSR
jgi:hypothetical protein